jgi:hypothetical protein
MLYISLSCSDGLEGKSREERTGKQLKSEIGFLFSGGRVWETLGSARAEQRIFLVLVMFPFGETVGQCILVREIIGNSSYYPYSIQTLYFSFL